MRTRKRWLVPSLAALLIVASGSVAAFGGWQGHHRGHGVTQYVYRLDNLTAEQRSGIQKALDASRDAAYERMKASRDDRRALREALQQGADPATIRPLAEKAGHQVTAMIMARAETRARIDALLTPQQRQQLQKLESSGKGACDRRGGDHAPRHKDSAR